MNKANHLKYLAEELLGQGNLNVVDTAFAANYTAHAGQKTHHGHKFIKQFTTQLRSAIPDLKIVKIEILSDTENVLTWQRTLTGTHKANLKGIPASNLRVEWYEMVVSRFEQDQIIEEWIASDLAFQLMLKQRLQK